MSGTITGLKHSLVYGLCSGIVASTAIKATRNTASTADNLSRKAGQFMKEKHSHPCKGGQDLGEGASTHQVCE